MITRVHSFINSRSLYLRNILTLITGTTFSQLIPLLVTPFLTRLYSPGDFGLLTMLLGATNLLAILFTGKYEAALIVPKEEKLAKSLLYGTLLLSLVTFCLCELFLFFFSHTILQLLNLSTFPVLLIYFLPLLAFIQAINLIGQNWMVRGNKFKLLSYSKIIESSSYSGFSLMLGILGLNLGLIVGRFIGQFSVVIFQFIKLFKTTGKFRTPELQDILLSLKKYKKFAIYFMPGSLLNKASVDLNFILFGIYFNNATVGFIGLINRIASVPTFFVATSIGNVYRKQAMEEIHETGSCYKTYKKTFLVLLALAAIPFTALFFSAPTLFSFFFGDNWKEAGKFMQVLTPFYFLQFITSPLSTTFIILEKQEFNFVWQFALAFSTVSAVVVGGISGSAYLALLYFSLAYSILYLINLYITFSLSKNNIKERGLSG